MLTIDEEKLCESCFEKTGSYPCPRCGFNGNDDARNAVALPKGTILQGRYVIGKMLGKGGFGITYLAYDYKKKTRVAIKEYFPNGIIYRQPGQTRTAAYDDKTEILEDGAEKFYQEAKTVSKFHKNENIITVYEFFKENNTSYFVMEYLDGVDLKTYVEKRGVLSEGEMKTILYAAVNVLGEIHNEGILHRDLSPDNIFICNDGRIMFLDFGAARQLMAEKSQSMSIILKQGFAPFEQYQRKSNQGPWSDIYAMGATAYYAMFGAVPEDAISRVSSPDLQIPEKYSVSIPFRAILNKMLAIFPESRYQNAAELKADLDGNDIAAIPIIPLSSGAQARPGVNSGAGVTVSKKHTTPISEDFKTSGHAETTKPAMSVTTPAQNRDEKSNKKGLLFGIAGAVVLALIIIIILLCLKTCSSDNPGGSGGGGGGSNNGPGNVVTGTQTGDLETEQGSVSEDSDIESSPTSEDAVQTEPAETYPPMSESLSALFSVNNNDYGYVTSDKQEFLEGETIKVTAVPKRGYKFTKWSDGDTNPQKTVVVNFARNYIAEFEAKSITVTLQGDSVQKKTVTYGDVYGELPTLTKTGYIFAGWYDSQNGGNRIMPESAVTAADDHTLYARFETVSLVSLKIASQNHKIGYIAGETLDVSDLEIVGVYSDGSEKPITGFTTSPVAGSKVSTSTSVTVSYNGKTIQYYISVARETVSSVSVASKPSKTSYFVGDTLDTSGLSIKVTYNSGRTETITNGLATVPSNGSVLSISDSVLTISYGGRSANVALTVIEVQPSSIQVYSMPNNTSYYVGDQLSTAGLRIQVTYNNGTKKIISSGFTTSPANGATLTASNKKITVSYEGKTTTFNINITPVSVSSISISSTPKTSYFEGEKLDISGLVINVMYNNGTVEMLNSGFTTSPANGAKLSVSNNTLTISYSGKTASIALTITPVTVTGINIDAYPSKTAYEVGESFSSAGLRLRVYYNNGTEKVVTSGFTLSITDGTVITEGMRTTVRVAYQGKSKSFNITIKQVNKYSVNLQASPEGSGNVTGGGQYANGTSVTVTATPNPGYEFDGWYNGNTRVSNSQSYTFNVNSDYPNLVARFSIKTYTYIDNITRKIDDSYFWGMGPKYMDELDMSEYSQFMTSDYVFVFEIEMSYEELQDGIQEIYLYNSNRTSNVEDMDYNAAVNLGLLQAKNNIGSTGLLDEILGNGTLDEGTFKITWQVNGSQMKEKMYIRYDAHGGLTSDADNDWYRHGLKVNVNVEKTT